MSTAKQKHTRKHARKDMIRVNNSAAPYKDSETVCSVGINQPTQADGNGNSQTYLNPVQEACNFFGFFFCMKTETRNMAMDNMLIAQYFPHNGITVSDPFEPSRKFPYYNYQEILLMYLTLCEPEINKLQIP